MKKSRRKLTLSADTVRALLPLDLARAGGGVVCSDPTCQICDTIKPQPGCC